MSTPLTVLACTAVGALLLALRRRSRPTAIPRIPSWWRPLGYARELSTNWQRFLAMSSARYGPIFSARILGHRLIFVNDHRLTAIMEKQPNSFRFDIAFRPQADKLFRLDIPQDVQAHFHKLMVAGLHGEKVRATHNEATV